MKPGQSYPNCTSTFDVRGSRFEVLLALLLLLLPAATQAADYTYTTNSGTITITGYTGPGGAVTIPSTINGLPVIGIGGDAFRDCTSLSSVTVPDSVTSIGVGAFAVCTSLTSITIPNNVTSIGHWAFYGCTSLDGIYFQGNAPSVGE
jgi:hypothetical protein